MKTFLSPAAGVAFALGLLATLTASSLRAQPVNNNFSARTVISGTNVAVTGSTVGATKESGEPSHGGNAGGASAWWSWTAPFSGFASISCAGSSFDTVMGVYTGTAVSALTYVASNDDEDYNNGIYTSEVFVDVVAGQTYQIAVDGYGGGSGTVKLQVVLEMFPTAAAWTRPDPYGVSVASSSLAGKVVILDYWATWCGPCKAEIPDFVYLQNKYRADGLVIVGASVDSTSQEVVTFLATNSPALNYQVVMANAAMQQAYGGISAIPTTFVIDRQNKLRKKWVGTQSRTTLERAIIPLLYGNTRLSSRCNGTQMVLAWPTNALAFTLESTTNASGSGWTAWSTSPTVINGSNTVSVPMAGSPRYFRLRMSY